MSLSKPTIGFIGLGVMGEPMCRNMLKKSGAIVRVFDINQAPVERLVAEGALRAASVAELAAQVDILFLSLPSGVQVEQLVREPHGIAEVGRRGLTLVDLSTSPYGLTRRLASELASKGIDFADAPVARTRQAAIDGTLSIMVGAEKSVFDRIHVFLACAASDITHCGAVGTGQVVKILNNMVLFQTVVALSEALQLGEAAGVDGALLYETLSKGSADSFALRNHGMKAMLRDEFPTSTFPTTYALKDVSYALELAHDTGFRVPGAELAEARMHKAREAGFGDNYFPVLIRVTDRL